MPNLLELWSGCVQNQPNQAILEYQSHSDDIHFQTLSVIEVAQKAQRLSNYCSKLLCQHKYNTNKPLFNNQTVTAIYTTQGSPLWVLGTLALWQLGQIVLLIDADKDKAKSKYKIDNAGCRMILTDMNDEVTADDSLKARIETIGITDELLPNENSSHECSTQQLVIKETDGAYIAYTSGSTGNPKAVLMDFTGMSCVATGIRERLGMESTGYVKNKKNGQIASLNFDPCWVNFFMMLSGIPLSLWAGHRQYQADLASFCKNQKITSIIWVPSAMKQLSPNDFTELEDIQIVGEHFTASLLAPWKKSGRKLLMGYGLTEATAAQSVATFDEEIHLGFNLLPKKCLLMNIDYTALAKPGEVGYIALAGPGLGIGFISGGKINQALNDKYFKTFYNPDSNNEEIRIYRTGDKARYVLSKSGESRLLQFIGRSDRTIKLGTQLLNLNEIQEHLTAAKPASLRDIALFVIPEFAKSASESRGYINDILVFVDYPYNDYDKLCKTEFYHNWRDEGYTYPFPKKWYVFNLASHSFDKYRQASQKFNINQFTNDWNNDTIPDVHQLSEHSSTRPKQNLTELEKQLLEYLNPNTPDDVKIEPSAFLTYKFKDLGFDSITLMKLYGFIKKTWGIINTNLDTITFEELVHEITYHIVFNQAWSETDTIDNSKPILFCCPPVSGSPSEFKHLDKFEKYVYLVKMTMPYANNREMKNMSVDYRDALSIYTRDKLGHRLNDIAKHCVDGMERYGVTNNYLICGYSWGGHLAYAITKHIQKHGKSVHFLSLFDSCNFDTLRGNNFRVGQDCVKSIFPGIKKGIFNDSIENIPEIIEKCTNELEPYDFRKDYLTTFREIILFYLDLHKKNDNRSNKNSRYIYYLLCCIDNLIASREFVQQGSKSQKIDLEYHPILMTTKSENQVKWNIDSISDDNDIDGALAWADEDLTCMGAKQSTWNAYFNDVDAVFVDTEHLQLLRNEKFLNTIEKKLVDNIENLDEKCYKSQKQPKAKNQIDAIEFRNSVKNLLNQFLKGNDGNNIEKVSGTINMIKSEILEKLNSHLLSLGTLDSSNDNNSRKSLIEMSKRSSLIMTTTSSSSSIEDDSIRSLSPVAQ